MTTVREAQEYWEHSRPNQEIDRLLALRARRVDIGQTALLPKDS